jgi:hypothetical protein
MAPFLPNRRFGLSVSGCTLTSPLTPWQLVIRPTSTYSGSCAGTHTDQALYRSGLPGSGGRPPHLVARRCCCYFEPLLLLLLLALLLALLIIVVILPCLLLLALLALLREQLVVVGLRLLLRLLRRRGAGGSDWPSHKMTLWIPACGSAARLLLCASAARHMHRPWCWLPDGGGEPGSQHGNRNACFLVTSFAE